MPANVRAPGVADLDGTSPNGSPLSSTLTFHPEPGTGLVGRDGVGKTTLLDLLPAALLWPVLA